jgi:hypothetical protein
VALLVGAGVIAGFAHPSWFPALFPSLILLAAASYPSVLIHECGHALAASFRVGSAAIRINLLPDPGGAQGLCVYDASRATRTDTVIIALAGPAASALAAVVAIGLYRTAGSTGLWHDFCRGLVITNVSGALLNLLPFHLTDGRKGQRRILRSDGLVALHAIRGTP